MRLQTKLNLALIPLIVAPLLALGAATYLQVRDNAHERTLKQMTTLLDQIGTQVRLQTSAAAANVGLLAQNSLVQKYALTSDAYERASLLQRPLLREFSRFQTAFPDYDDIRLLGPDGNESLRWNSDVFAPERPAPAPAMLARLRSSRKASAVFVRETGEPRLIAATALYLKASDLTSFRDQPKLYGYLSLTVNLAFLKRQLDHQVIADSGALMVFDAGGHALLTPDRARQSIAANPSLPPAVRQAMIATTAAPQRVQWHDRAVLVHGKRLAGGAYLLAAVPEAEVLAAGRRVGGYVAIITLLAALITPLLVLWVLRRLVLNPLTDLSAAADTMGRGELDAPIALASRDEMGALARRFDQMRENLRQTTRTLAHQADHDSLTGLPNRRRLDAHLQQALAETDQQADRLALLFLDLDGFKLVNDNLGHVIGDALLQALAKRLINCLRRDHLVDGGSDLAPDLISRIGGDEFLIVVGRLRVAGDAGRVAARILDAVREPVDISGHRLQLSASVGIALCPRDGDSAAELIANADVAMYKAKAGGRNKAVYFSTELGGSFQRRLSVERRLRRAIEHGELDLHYQPQVDTSSGRIVGLEALARWTDPETGPISPGEFIPLAEETGLIVPLTAWALESACRQNRAWQIQGLAGIPVAVNVSGNEILNGESVNLIKAALASTRLSPECLEIEITESTLLSSENQATQELARLREIGVGLALDDFGTGYSSLSYLRQLPFQKVKIDRSFVTHIAVGDKNAAIVSAVIAMAHGLDMRVVAEGVEQASEWQFLAAQGCEAIQGFLFSRPLDSAQAGQLLAQNKLPLPAAGPQRIVAASRSKATVISLPDRRP